MPLSALLLPDGDLRRGCRAAAPPSLGFLLFFFNSSSEAGGSGAGAEAPRVPAQPRHGGRCAWLSSPECRWEISGRTLLVGFIPLCPICPGEEVPYNKSALPVE